MEKRSLASAVGGVENLKTMTTEGRRSIPESEEFSFLDLYMLHKRRERLEKEQFRWAKKGKNLRNEMIDINKRIERMEKKAPLHLQSKKLSEAKKLEGLEEKAELEVKKRFPKKKMKRMALDY